MHSINFDEEAGIVGVALEGFWSLADVHRYRDELGEAVARAIRKTGHLKLLIDVREAPVLATDAAEEFQSFGSNMPHSPADKIAFVVRSTLLKLQLKRLHGDAPSQYFPSEEAARAWLSEQH